MLGVGLRVLELTVEAPTPRKIVELYCRVERRSSKLGCSLLILYSDW